MGQFSSFLKAWKGSRRAILALQAHHFNPFKNQNNPPFSQNSPTVYSFRLPYTGLFQPYSLGPKQLHSKRAELAQKLVLYFTHRNGPILGAKTDLFDLQCSFQSHSQDPSRSKLKGRSGEWGTCISVNVIYCITCTLCKKIYIDETGRRLADRFREYLRDVGKTTRVRPNQVCAILSFLITSTTTWQFAAYPYTTETQKAQKFCLSTWHTISTRDQRTPLTPLIYSQIHVTIFPPMAKLLHTPM